MSRGPQYDVPLPRYMKGLRRDHRGFVIPFFVAWLDDKQYEVKPPDGTPDFRVVSTVARRRCLKERLCWLCGQKMGRYLVFAIGPMCAATRTSSELACHYDCAHYAVRVCPFLARPKMRRNDVDMPAGHWMPGFGIDRNPGVVALWVTRDFTVFDASTVGAGKGPLITVGEPERVEWYAEGRKATRAEVDASVASGLPILRETADRQGAKARQDLEEFYLPRLDALLPAA